MNEGHAAFVALERARDFRERCGGQLDEALAATRRGNVFTTHTPVDAGFDRFAPDLVGAQLGAYARDELGLSLDELLALGRAHPTDRSEPFNTAWLAARCSGAINAVSRRHAAVSRRIFQVLFPRFPEREVPIGYVTNGVHVPSWDSPEADALWTAACGRRSMAWNHAFRRGTDRGALRRRTLGASREPHEDGSLSFVRERLSEQLAASGMEGGALDAAARVFDPDALTIGLARRFAEYKRPTLLLRDEDRLARLITQPVAAGPDCRRRESASAGRRRKGPGLPSGFGSRGVRTSGCEWCSWPTTIFVSRSVWSRASISGSTRPGLRGRHAERAE